MGCFTEDQLRDFLLRDLPPGMLGLVERHLETCAACCRTLDVLAGDDVVRDFLDAWRRESAEVSAGVETPVSEGQVEQPAWQPFLTRVSVPLQFGRFTLKRVLGCGGGGVVYLAEDPDLDREVAVKIPHLGGFSPDVRRRFLREGMATAGLHHPHIVQVYQSGTFRGVCYLVSEYCPGSTLQQFLQERQDGRPNGRHAGCEVECAARIVKQLAEAVEHAHQHGVVHRDIKPANVILDERRSAEGLPFYPKLADFGTAKFLDANHAVTSADLLIGTAPYMAPEQLSGTGEVGPACDIYALGVLLYELVTGRLPVEGTDHADLIRKVVSHEPVLLHRAAPSIPRDLSAICARCLEKDPARRYASARQLARDLLCFLNNEPPVARRRSAAGSLDPPQSRPG